MAYIIICVVTRTPAVPGRVVGSCETLSQARRAARQDAQETGRYLRTPAYDKAKVDTGRAAWCCQTGDGQLRYEVRQA